MEVLLLALNNIVLKRPFKLIFCSIINILRLLTKECTGNLHSYAISGLTFEEWLIRFVTKCTYDSLLKHT